MPHQKVKDYYDSLAPHYDEKYENPAIQHMRKAEFEVIEQYLKDTDSVIDIGCGTGLYALALAQKGCRVVGIDISHEMVEVAVSKVHDPSGRVAFLQHNIEERLTTDERFDLAVSMFGPLNHVESLEKTLENIENVLSPKGRLIFTVANYLSLSRLFAAAKALRFTDILQGKLSKTEEFYVREVKKRLWTRYYNVREVKKLLRKSNFEVEKVGGIFFLLKPHYHHDSGELTRSKKTLMQLERKMKWMFPINRFSEYLIFVCRRNSD